MVFRSPIEMRCRVAACGLFAATLGVWPGGLAAATRPVSGPPEITRTWLRTAAGDSARATVRIPRGTPSGSACAVVIAGGFGSGWLAAERIDPGPGVVLLSVDYPFEGPRRGIPAPEFLRRALEFRRALNAMDDLLLEGCRYAIERPEVDSSRVLVVGASLGVPFALRAAAREPRFKGVALLYGSADIGDWVARNLKDVPRWLRPLAGWLVAVAFRHYEPASLIRHVSPRPVLLLNARGDQRVSEEKAKELYEAAGEPKEQIWLDGGHMRLSNTELVTRLLGMTMRWARHHGFVRPTPVVPASNSD